jgi:DNA-directed RNA polymerase specialized sigma24 family protein
MSQLTTNQRAQILSALVEGTSIRGVSRITGASTTTILKLLADVGQACSEYQDEKIRGCQGEIAKALIGRANQAKSL